jgi:glutamate--cysteine ligase
MKIIENRELTEIFYSGCKQDELIGLEYEKIPVYKSDYTAVSYSNIANILIDMENEDRTVAFENKNPIGLIFPEGHISLEPGCQTELSLNPVKNISEIKRYIDKYNLETATIADKYGICWLALGIQPVSIYENIGIIPKKRYAEMTKYLPQRAKLPFVMMRETAGIQVGLDYSSEEDAMSKLKTALKLSPIISAIFANSPIRNLRLTGSKSFRAYSWLNTDEQRCGLISEKIFHDDFTFEDYKNVLLDIPMIFIEKNNKYISTGNMTFREYYQKGFEGYFPTIEDWNTHLSLFFPDVRLKSYLEIRNHDSQKPSLITSVPAIWKGILYNKDAREAIDDLFKGAEYKTFEELRYLTPEYGLSMNYKRFLLSDIAKEIISICKQSLRAMKTGEEDFLLPIEYYINKGITPADEIISKLQNLDIITVQDIKNLKIEIE